MLNIVATSPSGGTARDVRTVVFDLAPGTLIFAADDPDGDDNGPGNYAYPTADNFKPGAYDLQRFEVYDAGDRTSSSASRTRDLTPTFGSPLGRAARRRLRPRPGRRADLDGRRRSRSATTRIAPGGAWSERLIEVQGFGQQFVDAAGAERSGRSPSAATRSRATSRSACRRRARDADVGLGLHGRADRPGRLQPRPGARLPADAAGLPVRRLRAASSRPALHASTRARCPRRWTSSPRRHGAVRRARLHRAQPGDHRPGGDAVGRARVPGLPARGARVPARARGQQRPRLVQGEPGALRRAPGGAGAGAGRGPRRPRPRAPVPPVERHALPRRGRRSRSSSAWRSDTRARAATTSSSRSTACSSRRACTTRRAISWTASAARSTPDARRRRSRGRSGAPRRPG